MHPILLKIGPISIYSYGVMVALSFGLATFLIYRRAEDFRLDKDIVIDLATLVLIAGVAGARILYVLMNLGYYTAHPLEILNLARGGLIWYGAFLSAVAVTVLYIARKRLDFWPVADLMAPYAALAQAFGRIGCFLNGCCYGMEASPGYVFCVLSPDGGVFRHPTQVYSSLSLLFIFLILRLWQDRRHFNGEIFLGYCALYSFKRFFMEFLRGDNPKAIGGFLTFSQGLSLAVFFITLAVFAYKAVRWKKEISVSK